MLATSPVTACSQLHQIHHRYPSGFVFTCDEMSIMPGSCTAIIGHNGAGKSTCFQLLTLNLDPQAGKVFFQGQVASSKDYTCKQKIGYLPQNTPLPDWVTAEDLLNYAADLHQLSQPQMTIRESMAYWDCTSYRQQPLMACSHGMRKRVALALATLHQPELLILDEPFSGLDIRHMKRLEEYITHRTQNGLSTVLSSHIFYYIAKLCTADIWKIDQGKPEKLTTWRDIPTEEKISWLEQQILAPTPAANHNATSSSAVHSP
ncbi:MAG: ABC transporter ATP-binding protein [Zetaproteobacteria bacterium]|nr:ABC transporter ATP-binding protein [Zetaproteobacteria bacterium]